MISELCKLNSFALGGLLYALFTYIITTIGAIRLLYKMYKKQYDLNIFEYGGILGIVFNLIILFPILGWLIKLVLC